MREEDNRLLTLLEKYEAGMAPLTATYSFVKEFLTPEQPEYYWTYRYEHSLRVALWGKRIAEGEGWDAEPLMMACLLHDIGYPMCKTPEDFDWHPEKGAEVAEAFLKRIAYDEVLTKSICYGISIHDRWKDVPENATPFELSVRDADDLDRFDVMRLCLDGRKDIGERSAGELAEVCEGRLKKHSDWRERLCGTQTAKRFWEETVRMRIQFYERLQAQARGTCEMECLLNLLK